MCNMAILHNTANFAYKVLCSETLGLLIFNTTRSAY